VSPSPVGRAAQFSRQGYDLPEAIYAEALAWAKDCATFTVDGLASTLEACGVPKQVDLHCGPARVALPIANHIVGFWARTGCIRLAGTRLYRWAS
jgi:hypothetical protein